MSYCCSTQDFFSQTLTIANIDESIPQFSKEFFFPNMCHVCRHFGDEANLKRCGGCGMISYCSEEHQKKDWSSHKEICKAICHLKKKWKVNNLFVVLKKTATEKSHLYAGGNKKDNLDFLFSLKVACIELMRDIVHLIQRKLSKVEFQMFMFPRVCAVCYESDPKLLKNCKNCPLTCFCELHLNDPDHESECLKIRGCYNTVRSVSFRTSAIGEKLVISDSQYHPPEKKLPKSMLEFIETRLPELHEMKNSLIPDKVIRETIFKRFLSDRFSRAFTILFAMEKLHLNSAKSMVIHVVGAKFDEIFCCDWEVILHFAPELKELKLIFIGPQAAGDNIRRLCQTCQQERKKLVFKVKTKMYHDYCENDKFVQPDLIACFNPDFHGEMKTWEKSINVFDMGQCPLLVTAIDRPHGLKDKSIIASAFPLSKFVFCEENPFTYICYQRGDSIFPISSNNGFLFIYEFIRKKTEFPDLCQTS